LAELAERRQEAYQDFIAQREQEAAQAAKVIADQVEAEAREAEALIPRERLGRRAAAKRVNYKAIEDGRDGHENSE